jgi:hypothetical protein
MQPTACRYCCQDAFNSCSAAFLDKALIVNEYSTEGTCVLPHDAKGTLTAGEAELLGGRKANITKLHRVYGGHSGQKH